MLSFAPRITTQSLVTGALTLTVAGGNSINVRGILLSSGTATNPVFTIANGAGTTLYTVVVATNTSFEITTPTLYDAGLQITSSATGAYAAVFHMSAGI